MKTIVKPIPCLKITLYTNLGYRRSIAQRTQICYKAVAAAKFFSSYKHADWTDKVRLAESWGNSTRSEFLASVKHSDLRYERLYRRALKVFQNYLP
jgi:hypothetical protein